MRSLERSLETLQKLAPQGHADRSCREDSQPLRVQLHRKFHPRARGLGPPQVGFASRLYPTRLQLYQNLIISFSCRSGTFDFLRAFSLVASLDQAQPKMVCKRAGDALLRC